MGFQFGRGYNDNNCVYRCIAAIMKIESNPLSACVYMYARVYVCTYECMYV